MLAHCTGTLLANDWEMLEEKAVVAAVQFGLEMLWAVTLRQCGLQEAVGLKAEPSLLLRIKFEAVDCQLLRIKC